MSDSRTPAPAKVVVVARDALLGQSLVEHLAGAIAAAVALADAVPADAVVAVVVIDDPEMRETARRADAAGIAVIALAAPSQAVDGFVALPLPARPADLVDAVRRAVAGPADTAVGPFAYERSARRLVDGGTGQVVRLTEIEARVLDCLLAARDQPVTREAMLVEVWGYGPGVTTHTVASHIYRLRRKLDRPGRDNPLFSGPEGYRLAR